MDGVLKNLLKDDKLIQVARSEWDRTSAGHVHLGVLCTKEDLDKEDESKLTGILNNHAKVTRITAYFKRWWNEVAEVKKTWAKDRKG